MENLTIKAEIKMPSKAKIKKMGYVPGEYAAKFQRGAFKAVTVLEEVIKPKLDANMEKVMWGPFNPKYPYISRGGQFRGPGMRSLVDTGELKNSFSIITKFLQTKTSTIIKYDTPYASITHYGGAILPYGNPYAATVILPPRPWVEMTLYGGDFDWQSIYENEIEDEFNA